MAGVNLQLRHAYSIAQFIPTVSSYSPPPTHRVRLGASPSRVLFCNHRPNSTAAPILRTSRRLETIAASSVSSAVDSSPSSDSYVGRIPLLELDTAVLQFQNLKLSQKLEAKLSQIKEKQLPYGSSLKTVHKSWEKVTAVVESCSVRVSDSSNGGHRFVDKEGNLEMLAELDISNNQIRVLPDSFKMLTKLRVFRAQENPLQVPLRDIAEKGPQAIVQYMNDLVEMRNVKSQMVKPKKSWVHMCFFSKPNKRKQSSMEIV